MHRVRLARARALRPLLKRVERVAAPPATALLRPLASRRPGKDGGKAKPLTKPKTGPKDYSEEDKAFLDKCVLARARAPRRSRLRSTSPPPLAAFPAAFRRKRAEEKAIKEAAAKLGGKKK